MTKTRNTLPFIANARTAAGGSGRKRYSVESRLRELRQRLLEISDLGAAGALLSWDQATYMPKGGAAARARHSAGLRRLAHEKSVHPSLGRLIDQLVRYADSLPCDSDEASLIRVAKRDFDKATRVPAEHVARANELAHLPTTRGPGRGPRTILQPCCRSWRERSISAANTPNFSHPSSTWLTR